MIFWVDSNERNLLFIIILNKQSKEPLPSNLGNKEQAKCSERQAGVFLFGLCRLG
jgi:hypothetical protein